MPSPSLTTSPTPIARRRGLPREGTGRRPIARWTAPFSKVAVRLPQEKQPLHRQRSPSATDIRLLRALPNDTCLNNWWAKRQTMLM